MPQLSRSKAVWVLQVLARTVTLQLESSSAAVSGVVVDKVGRYAYAVGGDLGTTAMPLIVDVALDMRTKVRRPAVLCAKAQDIAHLSDVAATRLMRCGDYQACLLCT